MAVQVSVLAPMTSGDQLSNFFCVLFICVAEKVSEEDVLPAVDFPHHHHHCRRHHRHIPQSLIAPFTEFVFFMVIVSSHLEPNTCSTRTNCIHELANILF